MTDQVWAGCVVPDDRLYDVELNVWVQLDGDLATLGMTDIAQAMGGRLVQVTWKRPGKTLTRGRPVAVIESAKWVGPFPTPVTGELVEVNAAAFDADIAIANRDPYGAGWLARLRATRLDEERGHLLEPGPAFERYRAFIEDNDIRCFRCTD